MKIRLSQKQSATSLPNPLIPRSLVAIFSNSLLEVERKMKLVPWMAWNSK